VDEEEEGMKRRGDERSRGEWIRKESRLER
jgi:hypothetical protein